MKLTILALCVALTSCQGHDRDAQTTTCPNGLEWVTYAALGHAEYGDPGDGECLKVWEDGSTIHPQDSAVGCILGRECDS